MIKTNKTQRQEKDSRIKMTKDDIAKDQGQQSSKWGEPGREKKEDTHHDPCPEYNM